MKRILSILVLASILLCSFAACSTPTMTREYVVRKWITGTSTISSGKYFPYPIRYNDEMIVRADGTVECWTFYSRDTDVESQEKEWSRKSFKGYWKIKDNKLVCEVETYFMGEPDGREVITFEILQEEGHVDRLVDDKGESWREPLDWQSNIRE